MPEHLSVDDFSSRSIPAEADAGNSQHPEVKTERLKPVAVDLQGRLSLSQMTTKRWPLERDVAACRQLGLKHIGLWRLKYEEFGLENTAAILSEHGMTPSSLSWIGGFTCMNGYLLNDTLEESIDVIQYASWIGAKTVVVATGEQGRHILSHATRLTVESLQSLGDFARDKGVHLAVMPMSPSSAHGWTFLNTLRKTEDLLVRCNHPHVGLCLNSYHALQSRHWKSELENLLPAVKLVRLCDGKSSRRPKQQCLPMQGKMPLLSLLDQLETAGYRGLYEIDTWNDEIWQIQDILPFQDCVRQLTSRCLPRNSS
ncbi:MAG: sugar phosphate isomerase/epimerase [Planctomycetaceae bacterium]|nr:sugar phosphate isomerase/epimerase [Planctomycetaceae bacterium]